MILDLTSSSVIAAGGVLLALFLLWRAGLRRAKAAAEAALSSARLVSLGGRVLCNTGLIMAMQWGGGHAPGQPVVAAGGARAPGAARVLHADPRADRDHHRHVPAGCSPMNEEHHPADPLDPGGGLAERADDDIAAFRIEPVLDAEIVEDAAARPHPGRLTLWWLRSPLVPHRWKDRRQAVQAVRDLVTAFARCRSGCRSDPTRPPAAQSPGRPPQSSSVSVRTVPG